MKRTVLDCGLTILTEKYTNIPSFALSYTVKSGSCKEISETNGIHHLIEHMVFKGSDGFDLKQIADISDRLGGRLNAFTSREITQFYIKAIGEKLEESFDLLTDMVFRSKFSPNEYKKEIDVIKQEIKEGDDNPDSKAFEYFYEDVFGKTGIGLPIAGSVESVDRLDRDFVYDYYKNLYTPSNIILSCVGNIDHADLLSLASAKFDSKRIEKDKSETFTFDGIKNNLFIRSNENLKQLYVITGFKSIPVVSPDRYKLMLINDILGAGMSSRLFQKIREEKGLAYTINSFIDSYKSFGIHMIYSIVEPGKIYEFMNAVKNELNLLSDKGIREIELEKSKDHIKSSLILSLESNVAKMRFNINGEIYFKKQKKITKILDEINNVTVGELNEILKGYPDRNLTSTLIYGDVKEKNLKGFEFNIRNSI